MRKITLLTFVLLFILLLASITICSEAADINPTRLLQGVSCSTLSSSFPVYARIAELANKYIPEVQITLLNLGGSISATSALMDGTVDLCTSMSTVIYSASHGVGVWENQSPYKDFRILSIGYPPLDAPCVWKDSNINSMKDFEGKKLLAGMPGGGTETKIKSCFDALGIKPDYFIGSLQDAVAAMKDNRIAGLAKSLASGRVDSVHINLKSTKEIKFISFTEEEVERIKGKYPWLSFVKFPVGEFKPLPNTEKLIFVAHWNAGPIVRKDFPEELAYKLTKVLIEHWDELTVADPKAFGNIGADNAPLVVEEMGEYMHPGAIRAYREAGISIPESIIPPEMK